MSKIENQGSVSWLVTRDAMGMVSWVAKGKVPGVPEFILAKGFDSQLKNAEAVMVNEIVNFILKKRRT